MTLPQHNSDESMEFFNELAESAMQNNRISPDLYRQFDVKRGLRNANGSGVLAGLTGIGDVHGFVIDEGDRVPVQGRLRYRGIDVRDLINGVKADDRFGFEETAYLLLFGSLPTADQLAKFNEIMDAHRTLPEGFTEDMILSAPSDNIMNKLARTTLACYSYDPNPEDCSIANVLRQCIELIARFPTMVAYAWQAKQHYHGGKSLFIHNPLSEASTAETLLHLMRLEGQYTETEARMLDLMLVLHAEHGGGNNSSFTTHVISSSDTDTYSAIAGAIGSLKGRRHGGANISVMQMMEDLKANVSKWADESSLRDYLARVIRKEAFDGTGLIYGMGHAVYTLSDPRADILKVEAQHLAEEKGRTDEFELYKTVEKLAAEVFAEEKNSDKLICANVDFYSGFVYNMMEIPTDVFTPLFATARIAGWCAHRIEEIISGGRIYRPAYKNILGQRQYRLLNERG